jgi:hypothetical protein
MEGQMGAYVVALILMLGAIYPIVAYFKDDHKIVTVDNRVTSIVVVMTLVHESAMTYALNNPTVSGSIAMSQLPLPSWFTGSGAVVDITTDGIVRTWVPVGALAINESRQIVAALVDRNFGYGNIGVVNATGFFHNLRGNVLATTEIGGVPIGATVIFSKVRS